MSESSIDSSRHDNSQLQVRVGKRECPSRHSFRNKLGRIAWGVVRAFLFRPSPRICYRWRRVILRCFGATVGRNARIDSTVRIWAPWNLSIGEEASLGYAVDCYCVDRVCIGAHATVSQEAFLCTATHDVHDPHMGLLTAPILIDEQAWVCARAFVAPGVRVGCGAVLGACAVVTHDVEPWTIVAGNPARFIKQRLLEAKSPTPQ